MPPSPIPAPFPPSTPTPWNPIVISFVGAICTIFLILSYYRILGRYCFDLHGVLLRDLTRRRLLNEMNPDDPSLQFQSRALEPTILETLPAIQYRKKVDDVEEANGEGADCSVCLGEFEEGDWLRLLPNCAHVFHISCIDAWFQTHSNCPLCRSNVSFDFSSFHRCTMVTMLENLRLHGERGMMDDHISGPGISQSQGIWPEETSSGSSGTDSPSSIMELEDEQNVGCSEEDHRRPSSSSREKDYENQSKQIPNSSNGMADLRPSSPSIEKDCENQSKQIPNSSNGMADLRPSSPSTEKGGENQSI